MKSLLFRGVENTLSDELLLIGVDQMSRMPEDINKAMLKSGFINNENNEVDEYINQDVFDVLLDEELLRHRPEEFVLGLKKAMKENRDKIALEAIVNFGYSPLVVNCVLKQKKKKYINTLLGMKNYSEEAEVVFLKKGYFSFADKLLKRDYLSQSSLSAIVKYAPEKYVLKAIEHKNFDKSHNMEVVKLNLPNCLAKLIGKHYSLNLMNKKYIVNNCSDDCVKVLIQECSWLEDVILEMIVEKRSRDLVIEALKSKEQAFIMQKILMKRNCDDSHIVHAILKSDKLDYGVAVWIAKKENPVFTQILRVKFKFK